MKAAEHERHMVRTVVVIALLLAVGIGITLADAFGLFSVYDLR